MARGLGWGREMRGLGEWRAVVDVDVDVDGEVIGC